VEKIHQPARFLRKGALPELATLRSTPVRPNPDVCDRRRHLRRIAHGPITGDRKLILLTANGRTPISTPKEPARLLRFPRGSELLSLPPCEPPSFSTQVPPSLSYYTRSAYRSTAFSFCLLALCNGRYFGLRAVRRDGTSPLRRQLKRHVTLSIYLSTRHVLLAQPASMAPFFVPAYDLPISCLTHSSKPKAMISWTFGGKDPTF
jgi:hypothetical protein